jgi:hypothetical protein
MLLHLTSPLFRHARRTVAPLPRDFGPRMMRDIGLDPLPEKPPIPPFAALVTRV